MSLRSYIKRLIGEAIRVDCACSSVDILLAIRLSERSTLSELNDPQAYLDLLGCCLAPTSYKVKLIRSTEAEQRDAASKRFTTLLERLQQGAEPIPYAIAQKLALVADRFYGNLQALETANWAGDVGLHFRVSSSLGTKPRLLANVVRFMRPICCLELGTAYGMSGMVTLLTMEANGDRGQLTTIECFEPPFVHASELLTRHFGEQVTCLRGFVQDRLPEALEPLDRIDLLFHDAGHSREDYINDFTAVEPHLAPGSVVILDDIRWDNPRFHEGPARCYEGWRHIVGHPRVKQAAEIDESLGILLVE